MALEGLSKDHAVTVGLDILARARLDLIDNPDHNQEETTPISALSA